MNPPAWYRPMATKNNPKMATIGGGPPRIERTPDSQNSANARIRRPIKICPTSAVWMTMPDLGRPAQSKCSSTWRYERRRSVAIESELLLDQLDAIGILLAILLSTPAYYYF